MVSDLAADLLPDRNDDRRRLEAYTQLYGGIACSRGFVAMRLELPKEAPAASQESSGDVHPAGIMPSERSSSRVASP